MKKILCGFLFLLGITTTCLAQEKKEEIKISNSKPEPAFVLNATNIIANPTKTIEVIQNLQLDLNELKNLAETNAKVSSINLSNAKKLFHEAMVHLKIALWASSSKQELLKAEAFVNLHESTK